MTNMAAEPRIAPAAAPVSPSSRQKRRSPAPPNEPTIISDSPKRFTDGTAWSEAPSPSARTRDMNLSELTHAYQHLAAQASLDKACAKTVEASITDHSLWLDRHSQAGDAIMHKVEQRLKRQFGATAQTTQDDTTGAALRAHVQARRGSHGQVWQSRSGFARCTVRPGCRPRRPHSGGSGGGPTRGRRPRRPHTPP